MGNLGAKKYIFIDTNSFSADILAAALQFAELSHAVRGQDLKVLMPPTLHAEIHNGQEVAAFSRKNNGDLPYTKRPELEMKGLLSRYDGRIERGLDNLWQRELRQLLATRLSVNPFLRSKGLGKRYQKKFLLPQEIDTMLTQPAVFVKAYAACMRHDDAFRRLRKWGVNGDLADHSAVACVQQLASRAGEAEFLHVCYDAKLLSRLHALPESSLFHYFTRKGFAEHMLDELESLRREAPHKGEDIDRCAALCRNIALKKENAPIRKPAISALFHRRFPPTGTKTEEGMGR